jgi:hypothetical protein
MQRLLKPMLLIACCFVFVISGQAQNARGPSTPEERATAVKAAKLLESEPFHKDAKKVRQWFTGWVIEVPDITVELCGGYLEPLSKKQKNYSAEILGQMMFASAAFIIEYPEQAKDRVAVNQAGVEGALRTYEAILKEQPKAKWEFLDSLITRRDKGELRAYVEEIARTKCKAKQ